MSGSVRPHRWQPTRLHRPWDSPGKNTGVGCHFLLQCMKVKSFSPTLSDPMDCSLWGSSTHGIFQARVLDWGAIGFSKTLMGHHQNDQYICYGSLRRIERERNRKLNQRNNAENFLNLGKEIDILIQYPKWSKMDCKKIPPPTDTHSYIVYKEDLETAIGNIT